MSEPTEIVIRPFETADRDAVVARVRELQAHERHVEPRMKDPADIGLWYVKRLERDCARQDGAIFVAEAGGAVVGYACVLAQVASEDPDELAYHYAFVSDVAVAPALRGKGVGRRLVERCRDYAAERGATCLRINVLAGNEGAWRLYEAIGFVPRVIELEMPLET